MKVSTLPARIPGMLHSPNSMQEDPVRVLLRLVTQLILLSVHVGGRQAQPKPRPHSVDKTLASNQTIIPQCELYASSSLWRNFESEMSCRTTPWTRTTQIFRDPIHTGRPPSAFQVSVFSNVHCTQTHAHTYTIYRMRRGGGGFFKAQLTRCSVRPVRRPP